MNIGPQRLRLSRRRPNPFDVGHEPLPKTLLRSRQLTRAITSRAIPWLENKRLVGGSRHVSRFEGCQDLAGIPRRGQDFFVFLVGAPRNPLESQGIRERQNNALRFRPPMWYALHPLCPRSLPCAVRTRKI